MKKIGVERSVYKEGRKKVKIDKLKKEKEEEIERMKEIKIEIKEKLIEMVKERREGKIGENKDILRGMLWKGKKEE